MVGACLRGLIAASILSPALPGCSLLLDFSDAAGVHDAALPFPAAECAFDEPNDSFDTAATVTTADTGPAAICPTSGGIADLDYYAFTVPDGTNTVTLQVTYAARGSTGDLDLALYDSTQSAVASQNDFETTKTLACPSATAPVCGALAAGDYTFEVSASVPGGANDYTFSLAFQ